MDGNDVKGSGRMELAGRFAKRVLERFGEKVLLMLLYDPSDGKNEGSDIEILMVTRDYDEGLRKFVFDICSDIYYREERWISVYSCSLVRYEGYRESGFFLDMLEHGIILWKTPGFDRELS